MKQLLGPKFFFNFLPSFSLFLPKLLSSFSVSYTCSLKGWSQHSSKIPVAFDPVVPSTLNELFCFFLSL